MTERKHRIIPPLMSPQRLLLAPLLLVLLSHSPAEAGCPDRAHERAMESSCAEAQATGLYTQVKVSPTCGALGARWVQLANKGMCGCCVLKKEVSPGASNNGGGVIGVKGTGIRCAYQNKDAVIAEVLAARFPDAHGKLHRNGYDKYKHCAASCIFKRRCGDLAATAGGYAKEVKDLFDNVKGNSFGSGDIDADRHGILLGGSAKDEQGCLNACNGAYPQK